MLRLEFQDVRITYTTQTASGRGEIAAVDGVSLVVEPGSTVGLAGESGCGKSTLAVSVLRLLPANAKVEGKILLGDESVSDLTWGRLRSVRWTEASIVFQGAMHSLNPVRKVRDQIAEALIIHAKGADAKYKQESARITRVNELLQQVGLPRAKGLSYPHELSGGQKQRIMIAMALACEPDLIIADEPTTALDVVVQAQVLDLLTALVRDRGLSLIMISHDLSVLAATCERIVVMQDGRIVEQGPSLEIMRNPQHPHTQALASAFPVIGDLSSRLKLPTYTAPNAPHAEPAERQAAAHQGRPALEARNLSVTFNGRGSGAVKAVDSVNLTCNTGEIVALVGQSGSGKTTLARTLLGLQKPTGGEVLFEGTALSHQRKALKAYRRAVQFVLQDPTAALNPKHSVYEAVAEGPRLHKLDGDERDIVAAALAKAELNPPEKYFTAIPQELSGGQRQRVVIAGALALDPEFLVADEPVASLDASVRAGVLALLLKLKCELGLGALVITHDLGLAWNIADRVVVMYQGRIVEEGPVEEVLLNPQHEYTRRLLSVVPTRESPVATSSVPLKEQPLEDEVQDGVR
ncbi:peptide/nickel transport system ATP-binding protein [Arthrobacter pigmenti]|uniref:Peptide/nickel transport system ATP-binding protein n=1 Tax=Arthrobacter pigmenti TaxID=271432 RepID=A0A846RP51_9MICC|nr:ABC transporter ATP-binding protein [Arthrobacter pigmenti]NJC21555.1 peptide/nickel transport system ATP-binding protein [Arthrobacter pigmenti]